MQAQKAEGTRDLIGAEMRAWQKMQQIAAGVFEPFGFKPIETPAIEQVDVFVHGIGQSTDVVRKEMFRVFSGANLERVFTEGTDTKLKPKQRLALRPEGTAGVVRAVVENNLVPQGSTRLRRTTPRPCSAASVLRRAACASSTRWASSRSALPIRRQTPSASSCSWSFTSAWASIFQASSAH